VRKIYGRNGRKRRKGAAEFIADLANFADKKKRLHLRRTAARAVFPVAAAPCCRVPRATDHSSAIECRWPGHPNEPPFHLSVSKARCTCIETARSRTSRGNRERSRAGYRI